MKKHLRPATPELIVRDPVTRQPLPAEGAEVELTPYWRRRLIAEEVLAGPPPAPRAARRDQTTQAPAKD